VACVRGDFSLGDWGEEEGF
jgi:hypothetical protein